MCLTHSFRLPPIALSLLVGSGGRVCRSVLSAPGPSVSAMEAVTGTRVGAGVGTAVGTGVGSTVGAGDLSWTERQ